MKLTEAQQKELQECIDLSVRTAMATHYYKREGFMPEPKRKMAIELAEQMGELNFYYKHPELLISDKEIVKEARA